MNLPGSEKGGSAGVNEGGEIKCSKMLSQLLSNQAESTANTMKILGSLLKDDGCSLSTEEQQVAAKMMGKMMAGRSYTTLSRNKFTFRFELLSWGW